MIHRLLNALREPCPPPTGEIPHDTRFHLLSNERRIMVIEYIYRNGSMEIGDLATALTAIEFDIHPNEVTSKQRQVMYVSLYQTHLDKLAEHDVIDYDHRSGHVAPGPTLDELYDVLRCSGWT